MERRDLKMLGNDLLSRRVTPTVPSAQEGLTSVFGKGTGVSPPPWSPNPGIIPRLTVPDSAPQPSFSQGGEGSDVAPSYRVRRRRARRLLILRASAGGTECERHRISRTRPCFRTLRPDLRITRSN